MLNHTKH